MEVIRIVDEVIGGEGFVFIVFINDSVFSKFVFIMFLFFMIVVVFFRCFGC